MTEVTWSRERAIEGYLDALRGVRDLAGVLAPDEWAAATDLPAWTVFDNVAHVAAIEDELAGRPVPSAIHDWSQFPHVQTPFQQYTEVGVEARRGRQPSELVAELEALVDERAGQLESVPNSPDAEMRGPAGMVGPVSRVMGTRTFDVWAHEQDIRRATGRATRMTGPAAEASLRRMVEALPIVVARQAETPVGTVVRFVIAGEPGATATVQVGEGGRGVLVDDAEADVSVDAALEMDLETLQVLCCGRRSSASAAVDVQGDATLAERVILGLPVTP